jgi:hypothetical protein
LYLDEQFSSGGGFTGRSCRACKQPIGPLDRTTHIAFHSDPNGVQGLTGDYHAACSQPFASMAHILNMRPWG